MTYDKPITVQVQDLYTEEWADVLRLHARINKAQGSVASDAGAEQYRTRLTFEVRYARQLEDINYGPQAYRIVYNSRTFKVTDYDDYMEKHLTVKMVGEFYE